MGGESSPQFFIYEITERRDQSHLLSLTPVSKFTITFLKCLRMKDRKSEVTLEIFQTPFE
jgi:hypothetical protein